MEGRLVREPRPSVEQGWLMEELAGRIREPLPDVGFVLGDDPPTVRGTDIAFVAREKVPAGGLPSGFWRIAPDLAVEIVSLSNTRAEIREKVLEYLATGARLGTAHPVVTV